MSDPSQQPSGSSSSAGQPNDGTAPSSTRPTPRPLRGMASLRGAASFTRRTWTRSFSLIKRIHGTITLFLRFSSPWCGCSRSWLWCSHAIPPRHATATQSFRISCSPSLSRCCRVLVCLTTRSTDKHRLTRQRAWSCRGGARPPRQAAQMTARSIRFRSSARPTGKKVVPLGPGGSSLTPGPVPIQVEPTVRQNRP